MSDIRLPHRLSRHPRLISALCALVGAIGLVGCERPCAELASRLCAESRTEAECDLWRERSRRVRPATCEAALERLSRAATP